MCTINLRPAVMRGLVAASVLIAVGVGSAATQAPRPSREAVVAQMGRYIPGFVRSLSSVVAVEDQHQEVSAPPRKRDLRSEFLLVPYPAADRLWLSFRDVLVVDGRAVDGDRAQRLTDLFLQPVADATRRAREIAAAGERYDIAQVAPFDDPLLAVSLLQARYHSRFRFSLLGLDRAAGQRIRILEFEEVRRPSIIRSGIVDVMTRGLVWVEEESGRIMKTELRIGSGTFPLRVTTMFAYNEDLQSDVPITMEGWFPGSIRNVTIRATYAEFRRFQVNTTETVR